MQKPITYYAQTPAINSLCEKYGPYLEGMPHLEKLNLAAAVSQAVLRTEEDVLNSLIDNSSIPYLATCDGFMFEDHNNVLPLLDQLDNELDASMATNLVIGIYSNVDFPVE